MNISELKLQVINKIMQSDDADFALKAKHIFNNNDDDNNVSKEAKALINSDTVIAYRPVGQPLTIRDLKTEILQLTDDSKPGTHCSTKTRLKGILWL